MVRLVAALLIAVLVVATSAAHLSAAAHAALATGSTDGVASAAVDVSLAQAMEMSEPAEAPQSGATGCSQSSAPLTCAFAAGLPQHHSLAPGHANGAALAMDETSTPAGQGPSRLFKPPIRLS